MQAIVKKLINLHSSKYHSSKDAVKEMKGKSRLRKNICKIRIQQRTYNSRIRQTIVFLMGKDSTKTVSKKYG